MPGKGKSFFVFVILVFFCKILFSHAEVVDKIIVIVNDEIITQGEVDRILLPVYEQYKNVYKEQELALKINEARKNVLQKLIQDKLLLTEARRRQIEVEPGEVEEKIDIVRKRFPTEEEFKLALMRENIVFSELEKEYKERIMVDKLVDMEIRRRVSVSPNEILNYYESHKEEFKEPKKVKLRSLLIRISEKRPKQKALKLARQMHNRLKEGGDFDLLAKEYSDGPYAESGGDMGWVKEGELMERINDLVFSLDENEISGVLETDLGFHIFKVEEKMPPKATKFSEAKDRIEQFLFNRKLEKQLGEWLEELKENAYIAFR